MMVYWPEVHTTFTAGSPFGQRASLWSGGMMKTQIKKHFAAVILGSLALTACGGGATGGGEFSGTIEIDGSSTVLPLAEAVVEEFEGENPDVVIPIGSSGTGGGFEKFCSGETDISNASREIEEDEAARCEAKGIEFTEFAVAIDGLAVVASPENDWATCLTTEELANVFRPGSKVDNWSQVREGFPNERLTLYSPGEDSGTFDYFTDVINGEEGAIRETGITKSEDDNTLVTGVSGDRGGLGFFGLAYYEQNADELSLMGVDSGSGCVEPTLETVGDGTYEPLSRPLFIYVKNTSVERAEVAAFLQFFLDTAGELAAEVGYVPSTDEMVSQSQQALDALVGVES